MITSNAELQASLAVWASAVENAYNLPNPSAERTDAIIAFCRTFVPFDVTEDDIMHFSGNLSMDDVRFFGTLKITYFSSDASFTVRNILLV